MVGARWERLREAVDRLAYTSPLHRERVIPLRVVLALILGREQRSSDGTKTNGGR